MRVVFREVSIEQLVYFVSTKNERYIIYNK
jgi:hypothetical protein